MGLYDVDLAVRYRRRDEAAPAHVAVMITERDLLERGAFDTLEAFFEWAVEFDAERITVAVSVLDRSIVPSLKRELAKLDTPLPVCITSPDDTETATEPIRISIGLGGREEFAAAVRDLAEDVATGELAAEAIDEDDIADRLVIPEEPDLLIKTGTERLSNFAIWQSVYSELYFTDVNWRDFRKRDYLRAVLDFQDRQRRFGR